MKAKMKNKLERKLEEFGDNFLGIDDEQNMRSLPYQKRSSSHNTPEGTATRDQDQSDSKKKGKRKKKKKKEAALIEEEMEEEDSHKLTGEQRHLEEIRKQLGLDALQQKAESDIPKSEEKEKERSSHSRKRPPPEVVVFDDPKIRKKKRLLERASQHKDKHDKDADISVRKSERKLVDLRQAKFDVQQFSIKNLRSTEKEEAKVQLALSLGAKPGKREYTNYKELVQQQKEKKAEEAVLRAMEQAMGFQLSGSQKRQKKKRKKNPHDVAWADGQVGKYRSGVQVVRQRDLVAGRASRR